MMTGNIEKDRINMAPPKILTRNFILCFSSQVSFAAVFHTLLPTLPIFLSRSGVREVEIGILVGALSVSSLVFRPLVGRGLSIVSEKKFMLTGASLFLFTSAAFLVVPPFWPFLIIRILQGVGFAFFYTAAVTLVANISPESRRGETMSYFYMAFNVSFALSPPLGIYIINRFESTSLFLVCAGLSLCSLVLASQLRVKPTLPKGPAHHDKAWFSTKALPPAIIYFFTHIFWGTLAAFFPLYAIGQGVKNPGFFFVVYSVILILSRAFGGKILDKYPREKVLLPCLTAYIVSLTVLAFSKTIPLFILVAFLWALGNGFTIPALVAFTIDLAGSSRGPAMAMFTALGDLGTGLGPIIMSIILRYSNYRVMFLCLALTAVMNLSYFEFFVRRKKKVVGAPAPV